MIRSKFFSRFIVVTLTAALLLVTGSRAIHVSALADPVQSIAPVFDTEIIRLADYVDNGGLTDPQLDIFFFLTGSLAAAQFGAQDAKLISPYADEDSVKEWLINCGIQLYNTTVGLISSGDYYIGSNAAVGSDLAIPKESTKALVAMMMGEAVYAANFTNLDDFLSNNTDVYVPFDKDLQLGLNAVFGLHGGLENWQLSRGQFQSNTFDWAEDNLSGNSLNTYKNYVSQYLSAPYYVFANSYNRNQKNCISSISEKYNLFLNGTNLTAYIVDDEGHNLNGLGGHTVVYSSNGYPNYYSMSFQVTSRSFSSAASLNAQEVIQYILDGYESRYMINCVDYRNYNSYFWNIANFIDHYYYGTSWENRIEIFKDTDLNIAQNASLYYQQLQDRYLLNIMGMMRDLVDSITIKDPFIDNLTNNLGITITPDILQVSVDLQPIIDLIGPPIPVNLNDIAEYTDNSYLERIKEEAQRGGNALAYLVAFWHNCDAELIYVLFGAGITVLVGAFIGKWGHS